MRESRVLLMGMLGSGTVLMRELGLSLGIFLEVVNYVIWCGLLLSGFTVWFSSLNSISGPNEHCSAVVGGM